ncbi:hypothetical protein CBER1_05197 [Cercospora berteroae]|uniref:Uncharacterized protein n=1 Tax=Cercospora berteroae TaxID=357750 RepID=A0A2S6BRT2_9PEZI|nr:hypothetical protein CBER1_05197 [Cercospora berteroae]
MATIVKVPRLRRVLKEVELEVVYLFKIRPAKPFAEFNKGQEVRHIGEKSEEVIYETYGPDVLDHYIKSRWSSQLLDAAMMGTMVLDIFSTLAQHRIVPNVTVILPTDNEPFRGFGSAWLVRNLFPAMNERAEEYGYIFKHRTAVHHSNEKGTVLPKQQKTTAVILEAIAASETNPHSLGLKGGHHKYSRRHPFEGSLYTSSGANQIFSGLRTLSVSFANLNNTGLLPLLSTSKQLEKLEISMTHDPDTNTALLSKISKALPPGIGLKHIVISHALFDHTADITDFLGKHKHTLETVIISLVCIEREHEWPWLFARLSRYPKLEAIEIHKALSVQTDWTWEDMESHKQEGDELYWRAVMCDKDNALIAADYRIRGKEAVKEVLEELASFAPFFERYYEKKGLDGEKDVVLAPQTLTE